MNNKKINHATIELPAELYKKLSEVCEAYGFMRNSQHDIRGCLAFLLETVASDQKTKDLRIRQLHDQSVEIQQQIARLSS